LHDFNERNIALTKRLLKQGFLYQELRRKFSNFYKKHTDLVSKYNVSLLWLLSNGISHPSFYNDVLKRIRKLKHKYCDIKSALSKLINLFLTKGYNRHTLKQTILLVYDVNFVSTINTI
jgi:hypothetical protein